MIAMLLHIRIHKNQKYYTILIIIILITGKWTHSYLTLVENMNKLWMPRVSCILYPWCYFSTITYNETKYHQITNLLHRFTIGGWMDRGTGYSQTPHSIRLGVVHSRLGIEILGNLNRLQCNAVTMVFNAVWWLAYFD